MTWETCYTCGTSGETDDDVGGKFAWATWFGREVYYCASCVEAELQAAEIDNDKGASK